MDHLLTEARNPASTNLDELTPLELVRLMTAEDARVIPAVVAQAEAIAQAIEVIADRLRSGGRLIYAGAGTSGRLGVLDATECPPTFNSPPGQVIGIIAGGPKALTQAVEGAEDHPELGGQDLAALGLSAADVLVGIATSGRTPYVLGAVDHARAQGAFTVGLSCNPDSDLGGRVDLAITVPVGPEVLSGSTRLKAGTATKLVLNLLSTGALVRLGKTFSNLMVDLRATNSKLRARSNRIVRILTGISVEQADGLLQRCGGELKTALVVQLAGIAVDEARARLQVAGGWVRRALGASRQSVVPAPSTKATPSLADGTNSVTQPEVHSFFLGIDGGGTSTVALLARPEGGGGHVVLGRGVAGPSNLHAVGHAALTALGEAVRGAFAAAGLAPQPVAAACLGLAGAGRPDDQRIIHDWAREVRLAAQVEILGDVPLLLEAGTPEGWGIAIVAGTGSIAFGQSPDGRTARAGGWGYLLGDEGSGYALTLAGLQAVARAVDGRGPATALTALFLKRFGLQQPQELIATIYRGNWDRTRLAALAPEVLEAAAIDAVAATVVAHGADALAEAAVAVSRQLGWQGKYIPLALAGGVLLGNEAYRQRLLEALAQRGVTAEPVSLVAEPAEGALRRAVKHRTSR
jgi:N-acetylmuramic acid 6-phosphate etherase